MDNNLSKENILKIVENNNTRKRTQHKNKKIKRKRDRSNNIKKNPAKSIQTGGIWGTDLKSLFRAASWFHLHRVYRLWYYLPRTGYRIAGFIFGPIFFNNWKNSRKRLIATFKTLDPSLQIKDAEKRYRSITANMTALLLDMMFYFPNVNANRVKRFLRLENSYRIEEAYSKNKGVIFTSLHLGNFFHLIAALTFHPSRPKVCVIGSFNNLPLFEQLMIREDAWNLKVLPTQPFSKLKPTLIKLLKENYGIIIYYDFTNNRQLRVPFLEGKYPYIVPTPLSVASLQRETGAVIQPAIVLPDGMISKSKIVFLDPSPIEKTIEKLHKFNENKNSIEDNIQNNNENDKRILKKYYGEIATSINKEINSYLVKYMHCWEEAISFYSSRLRDEWAFKWPIEIVNQANQANIKNLDKNKEINILVIVKSVIKKVESIIEYSYEPKRDDVAILNELNKLDNDLSIIIDKRKIFLTKNDLGKWISDFQKTENNIIKERLGNFYIERSDVIDLTALSTKDKISVLIKFIYYIMGLNHLNEIESVLHKFTHFISRF